MKVAFVFSGVIRDLNRTTEIFQRKIEEFNADVYASFWDIENPEDGDTIKNFKNNFKPNHLEIESWNSFKKSTWDIIKQEYQAPRDLFEPGQVNIRDGNFFSMWYKVWRANMLTKLNPEPYDVVVRLRTDLILSDWFTPKINEFLNIPHGTVWIQNWLNCYGPHDFLAYGSPEIMDIYSSVYHYLNRYVKEGVYMYIPENTLRHHLGQFDISVRYYGDTILLRDGGNIGRNTPDEADIIMSTHNYKNQEQDPNKSFYKSRT